MTALRPVRPADLLAGRRRTARNAPPRSGPRAGLRTAPVGVPVLLVVATEDCRAPRGTGPRFAGAGMALGLVTVSLVGVGMLVVLLAWASLA